MDLMIEDLMEQLVQGGGSDLHLATGQPPYGRFSGELRPMTDRPLAEEDCNKLIFSMLNNSQRKTLEQTWELDCAYGLKGVARFRVNVYRQKGSYAACLRALGSTIPSVELLNLPPVVLETSARPRGLVLVTGPTGSGKDHHPGGSAGSHQSHPQRTHPHDRRPDRIRVSERQKPGAPTPAQRRHPQLRQRLARRTAGGPGRDPGG